MSPAAAHFMEDPPAGLRARARRFTEVLEELGSVCVGYSGGVDSAYLAVAAVDTLGAARVLAVTGLSPAYPGVQRAVALEVARSFGVPQHEITTQELADPRYAANPTDRCYFCKTELWACLRAVADQRGLRAVVDGANADDAADYRPGARAAREHGVRSPLQEAGLDKADVRALSRARGLPTWDQPASPCLASRLPYGLSVTPERLAQVEAAEAALRDLGLREFRVRHHGDVARVEVAPAERERALARARELQTGLEAAGFARAVLDVDGYRRGALNEGLPLVALRGGS